MATKGITDIFFDILERVKALDPVNVRNWFDDLVVTQFDGGHLNIGCPDEATAHQELVDVLSQLTEVYELLGKQVEALR